jgi:hypothetical protein
MANLPNWISIDPLASIPRFLQGFAQGASVGESLRHGEQRAAEQADVNARFTQELSQREANAQREYALREQVEQEKAKVAARNLVGMQEYQSLVASGVPKDKALMHAAPNLFYQQPEKLTSAMHQLAQEEQQAKSSAISQGHLDVAVKNAERSARRDAEQTAALNSPVRGQPVFVGDKEMDQWFAAPSPGGGVGLHRRNVGQTTVGKMTDIDKLDKTTLSAELKAAQTDWDQNTSAKLKEALGNPEEEAKLGKADMVGLKRVQAKKARLDAAKEAWDSFTTRIKSGANQPASGESKALPMPTTKSDLVKGKTYQTRRGPATWDGDSFVR